MAERPSSYKSSTTKGPESTRPIPECLSPAAERPMNYRELQPSNLREPYSYWSIRDAHGMSEYPSRDNPAQYLEKQSVYQLGRSVRHYTESV